MLVTSLCDLLCRMDRSASFTSSRCVFFIQSFAFVLYFNEISGGRERVPALSEDLHQILCKIMASQIQTKDGVRQSVTFEDGHCVQHTVNRIHHEARRPSRRVRRQDSLGRQDHGVHVENLKHDLRHTLSVSLGVQKGVRGQNGMFFRRNPEFVEGRVMPARFSKCRSNL